MGSSPSRRASAVTLGGLTMPWCIPEPWRMTYFRRHCLLCAKRSVLFSSTRFWRWWQVAGLYMRFSPRGFLLYLFGRSPFGLTIPWDRYYLLSLPPSGRYVAAMYPFITYFSPRRLVSFAHPSLILYMAARYEQTKQELVGTLAGGGKRRIWAHLT